ncbi:hypothetical protein VP01_11905g1, partial [Puccinia sorghi]
LQPKGEMGILIGYRDELSSYCILSDSGRIIESKKVQFLDYHFPVNKKSDWDLSIEETAIMNDEEFAEDSNVLFSSNNLGLSNKAS